MDVVEHSEGDTFGCHLLSSPGLRVEPLSTGWPVNPTGRCGARSLATSRSRGRPREGGCTHPGVAGERLPARWRRWRRSRARSHAPASQVLYLAYDCHGFPHVDGPFCAKLCAAHRQRRPRDVVRAHGAADVAHVLRGGELRGQEVGPGQVVQHGQGLRLRDAQRRRRRCFCTYRAASRDGRYACGAAWSNQRGGGGATGSDARERRGAEEGGAGVFAVGDREATAR